MRREDFCAYIAHFNKKGPLELDTPAERLSAFKNAFQSEPDDLEQEMLQYIHAIARRTRQ